MDSPGRKIPYRLIVLILILAGMGGFLFFRYKPPGSLKYVLNPALDRELGIKTYAIKSAYQKHENIIKVLLPDNMTPGRHYPVLYILPVNPGIWDDFWLNGIREAARRNIQNKYQVICVYPRYEHMPWFGDNPENPSIKQESHLLYAVIPFVDHNFPTVPAPGGRFLAGFSKSGWGAWVLLLRHPDLFGKAATWDAPLMFDNIWQWATGLKEVFGTDQNFRHYYLPGLLLRQADQLRSRPACLVLMGYALIQDHTDEMHRFLDKYQIPHVYQIRQLDRHAWDSGWLEEAARLLVQN